MKARDVMEPAGDSLRLTDTLKDSVRLMRVQGDERFSGLAVEDTEVKLIGVVTKMEVLKAIVLEYLALENLEEFT